MPMGIFEIIDFCIIVILLIFGLLTIMTLVQKYRKTKSRSTLYFLSACLSFMVAGAFLALEEVGLALYVTTPDKNIELFIRINVIFGMIAAGMAIIFINIFAFENTFSEKKLILSIGVAIVDGLYTIFMIYANVIDFLDILDLAPIIASHIVYVPLFLIYLIPIAIVCGITAPTALYYFSAKTWSKKTPTAKRSLWMALAMTIFAFGYLIEIGPLMGPFIEYFLLTGRIMVTVAVFIFYVCFKMPQWFKDSIGWTED
ncbi:MAG: hypothetical protein ACTSRB_17440 [Candidatus Helarchaeota archaeon]